MLPFLFQANFRTGDFIQQTHADESPITPGKNCFYDVKQRIDDVASFGFFSDEHPNTYAVDLSDGHFEINGVQFTAQDPSLKASDAKPVYRLVYFKQNRIDRDSTTTQTKHYVCFHLGWQYTTEDGRNVQQTIATPWCLL